MKTNADTGVTQSPSQRTAAMARSPQKLDEERQGPSLESLQGVRPRTHLDFRFLASRSGGE